MKRSLNLLALVVVALLCSGCPWWGTEDTSKVCELGNSGKEIKCQKPGRDVR